MSGSAAVDDDGRRADAPAWRVRPPTHARWHHALPRASIPGRLRVSPLARLRPASHGPVRPRRRGQRAADWPVLAPECASARPAESGRASRPLPLSAGRARLGASVAHGRPSHPGAGPGRAHAGRSPGNGVPGAGHAAVRGVGSVHDRAGVAWAGAAARMGGAALSMAQRSIHPNSVCAGAAGGGRLAGACPPRTCWPTGLSPPGP